FVVQHLIPVKPNHVRVVLVFVLAISQCSREQSVSHEGNSLLHIDETKVKNGDVIRPFAYIKPSENERKVQICIYGADLAATHPGRKMTSRRFWTSEEKVLSEIAAWEFVYGRKATHNASSTIRIYRDNQMVEKHGIVIERHTLAFQSVKYGMLMPNNDELLFRAIEHMKNY